MCVLLHMNAITMKIGVLLKKKQKQKQQQKNGDCTHDKTPKQFFRTTEHTEKMKKWTHNKLVVH